MSKILITGHKGWIGSNLTKLLDQAGIKWIGIDRVEGEDLLEDIQPLYNKLRYCDTVVHLAASTRIPPSWKHADQYRENNVGVTDQIARICAEQGKYLIYASSSSIYGDGSGPLNPYAWTKLAGEQSIEMYAKSKGLKYTILRFFTNYSENDTSGLVIGKWLKQYKEGQALTIRGNGQQSRDFIHVMDTARAVMACCEQKPVNRTLDIGIGESVKLQDIADIFNTKTTYEPELPGYANTTEANIIHTQMHLQWWPRVILQEWIRSQMQ